MNNNTKPDSPGTLYVVSTPIGNLEDITLRAIRIMKEVDIIAAESSSHTKRLCDHYDIRSRITSYNQHNHKTRAGYLLDNLIAGKNIALVTSAGTPTLSDPGALFIREAHDAGIKVSPIPGPSAAIAGLSVCGLKTDRFVFSGFLSNKQGKRKREINDLSNEEKSMVFYESPRRILSMLKDIREIMGNRRVVILRELTKIYEEILHDDVESIIQLFEDRELKGEFTLIVEGKKHSGNSADPEPEIIDRIKESLKKESSVKDLALKLSNEHSLNYRTIYKQILELKKNTKLL